MADIETRAMKGSALSHGEMDANFNNLNTDKVEQAAVDTTVNAAIPIGTIAMFALAPPTGWLACEGQSLARSGTYATLFAYLGIAYGNVDGSTFNLPDYRGYFLRHVDGGEGTDPDAASRTDRGDSTTGDNVGTKQSHDFETHSHTYTRQVSGNVANGSGATPVSPSGTSNTSTAGTSTETRPLNINIFYCIRAE